MKSKIIFTIALFFAVYINAQEKVPFALVQKGSVVEYSVTVGEKRKPNMGYAFQTKEITDVKQLGDGTTRVIAKSMILNKKKKVANLVGVKEGSYTATDIKDNAYVIGSLLFGQINETMNSDGFLLKVPATMNVGDKMECGTAVNTLKFMGRNVKQTVTYSDFSVVAEEDITTNAGTFHCYVIKGNCVTEIQGQSTKTEETYWMAEGVGVVRYIQDNGTMNYNPIYFELTMLSRP